MTSITFKEVLKQAPFQPVRVVMSSGESYIVTHPEMALASPACLVLSLPDPSREEGVRLTFCSWPSIAHVEQLAPSSVG
ncbi:MAG: hypothetical protein AAF561_11815 [Planctomycetota bacterium]